MIMINDNNEKYVVLRSTIVDDLSGQIVTEGFLLSYSFLLSSCGITYTSGQKIKVIIVKIRVIIAIIVVIKVVVIITIAIVIVKIIASRIANINNNNNNILLLIVII